LSEPDTIRERSDIGGDSALVGSHRLVYAIALDEGCVMKLCKAEIRLQFHSCLLMLALLICNGSWQPACAQPPDTFASVANAPLTTEQIVKNLVGMNFERAQALHAYHGTRTYRVEYRGFPRSYSAEMIVDVDYRSPGTKEFTIRSATGSVVVIDQVFKKLLLAEQETLAADAQRRAALNDDNYDFKLVGYESTPFGSMYVLSVEPKAKDKFLYRGRIWVDAEDFAVARIEAQPGKSPSFWTKNSEIVQEYMKVSDFWLPARNRSIAAIRLGGRAELIIQYSNYQITSAGPIDSLSMLESPRQADTRHAQRQGDHP